MATNQYIGARYVPLFADPYDWSDTQEYEPLTVVYSNGNSYTSRQYVPKGTPLTDENYWVITGNYNAQVEQYRKETKAVSDKYDTVMKDSIEALSLAKTNERDIAANDAELAGTAESGLKTLITEEAERAKREDSSINDKLTGTTDSGLKTLIEANDAKLAGTDDSGLKTLIEANDAKLAGTGDSGLKTLITEEAERAQREESSINSKFPIASDVIADGAVTAPKMATSAVSSILQGFTVRYFDNEKPNADNTGLTCPAGGHLAGFYIMELGILVINRFDGTAANNTDKDFTLPTYVPDVNDFVKMAGYGAVGYTSTNNFANWTGVRYAPGRHIVTNTYMQLSFAASCAVGYLKPYAVSEQSTSYANATSYNQII